MKATLARTLVVLGTLFIPSAALAAGPTTMIATGLLRAAGGGPVADGGYDAEVSLWDAAKAGNKVWFEAVTLGVGGGRFDIVLGKNKPLDKVVSAAGGELFLELRIGQEPPLGRTPIRGVAFAYRAGTAGALGCSGCVGKEQLAVASVGGAQTSFSWAGGKTKGGPALSALDLVCTGCVSVAEMKFDANLNLKGHAINVSKLTVADLVAQQVYANSFTGDGSKLTGIQTVKGTCAEPGEVVKGIRADGGLICATALEVAGLPPDGLDEVSNGLLTNQYIEVVSKTTALPIQDNNPVGVSSELVVPDLGVVHKVVVNLEVQKSSDIAQLKVVLYPPDNKAIVLHDGTGKGGTLGGSWPPNKVVVGDPSAWASRNPKGIWRLQIIDRKASGAPTDGHLERWSLALHTVSSKKVTANGKLIAKGGFQYPVAAKAPGPCNAAQTGTTYFDTSTKALTICNGSQWDAVYVIKPGSHAAPALDCRQIRRKMPGAASGRYWLDIDGDAGTAKPFQAWCDMSIDGGGWTLALNLDTSDGHVMWWANPLWTNNAVYGDATKPFASDHKSPAYSRLKTGDILLVVHKQGVVVGWKRFARAAAKSLLDFMKGGDNTLMGSKVVRSSSAKVWSHERLVRLSTKLYANHCVHSGGGCVSGNSGSPDGDRIGSAEGTPRDNDGGGLGNWHDMGYCCAGKSYAGKSCNGSAFRTTSEAQAGWGYSNQYGLFGTDTFGAATNTENDSGCARANWAKKSGVDYDYAIFVGGL